MYTLLIQAEKRGNYIVPAQDFGYTAMDAIDFQNWYEGYCEKENKWSYVLELDIKNVGKYIGREYIPVGSIEFCLEWFRANGVQNVPPLNIPETLWKFVKREIGIAKEAPDINKKYFCKNTKIIKDEKNDFYEGKYFEFKEPVFYTEFVDDIVSEWRCFVYNGKLQEIKCHSGDEWVLPDKEYIESIISNYNNPAYTLDVMVRKSGKTDIVELHDFYACGLYGYDDYTTLLKMWKATKNKIMK